MSILKRAREARNNWPNTTRKSRAVQAVRLALAKTYMEARGIVAVDQEAGFKYARSTGAVLQ